MTFNKLASEKSSILVGSSADESTYSRDNLDQNLLKCIVNNPGIRYRQLLRLTKSSNGRLSYHLAELEESKRILVDRKKRMTRYFSIDISVENSKIIGFIRNAVSRQVIALLLKNNGCTLSEISAFTMKAPSTISWHLQRLISAGIVRKISVKLSGDSFHYSRYYDISDRIKVENVLSSYKENVLDRVLNDYSELMDELI